MNFLSHNIWDFISLSYLYHILIPMSNSFRLLLQFFTKSFPKVYINENPPPVGCMLLLKLPPTLPALPRKRGASQENYSQENYSLRFPVDKTAPIAYNNSEE